MPRIDLRGSGRGGNGPGQSGPPETAPPGGNWADRLEYRIHRGDVQRRQKEMESSVRDTISSFNKYIKAQRDQAILEARAQESLFRFRMSMSNQSSREQMAQIKKEEQATKAAQKEEQKTSQDRVQFHIRMNKQRTRQDNQQIKEEEKEARDFQKKEESIASKQLAFRMRMNRQRVREEERQVKNESDITDGILGFRMRMNAQRAQEAKGGSDNWAFRGAAVGGVLGGVNRGGHPGEMAVGMIGGAIGGIAGKYPGAAIGAEVAMEAVKLAASIITGSLQANIYNATMGVSKSAIDLTLGTRAVGRAAGISGPDFMGQLYQGRGAPPAWMSTMGGFTPEGVMSDIQNFGVYKGMNDPAGLVQALRAQELTPAYSMLPAGATQGFGRQAAGYGIAGPNASDQTKFLESFSGAMEQALDKAKVLGNIQSAMEVMARSGSLAINPGNIANLFSSLYGTGPAGQTGQTAANLIGAAQNAVNDPFATGPQSYNEMLILSHYNGLRTKEDIQRYIGTPKSDIAPDFAEFIMNQALHAAQAGNPRAATALLAKIMPADRLLELTQKQGLPTLAPSYLQPFLGSVSLPGASIGDYQALQFGNSQTLGVKQNNPGNIRGWKGYPSANGYNVFPTPEVGIEKMVRNLRDYGSVGWNTESSIASHWAPKGDGANNPAAYAAFLASQTGIDANTRLNLNDPETLKKLIPAMIKQEQGYNPYGNETINNAINTGLGSRGVSSVNAPPSQIGTFVAGTGQSNMQESMFGLNNFVPIVNKASDALNNMTAAAKKFSDWVDSKAAANRSAISNFLTPSDQSGFSHGRGTPMASHP